MNFISVQYCVTDTGLNNEPTPQIERNRLLITFVFTGRPQAMLTFNFSIFYCTFYWKDELYSVMKNSYKSYKLISEKNVLNLLTLRNPQLPGVYK